MSESDDLKNLFQEEPNKYDEQIQALTRKLENEIDRRKEDRFFFILVGMIIFDVIVFMDMPSTGGPISILVLELIALILLARHYGIEEVKQLLDRLLGNFVSKVNKED